MIIIENGMFNYNYALDIGSPYYRDGFYHIETRRYLPMSVKFRDLLYKKARKFWEKYRIEKIAFTIARDLINHIDAITILHPWFDIFNPEIGESIVIGRIKRMRGEVKKVIYEYEDYEVDIKLYDKTDKSSGVTETVYKTITRKRFRLDGDNCPIIKKMVSYKPYEEVPEFISVIEA